VGALYGRLEKLCEDLVTDEFRGDTADSFQAQASEWRVADTPPGSDPPAGVHRPHHKIQAGRDRGSTSDRETRGAPDPEARKSHFRRFLDIYQQFPETNERYGQIAWRPALEVPTHPNTRPLANGDEAVDEGRITNTEARLWAQLFNLRYRMLLVCLMHALESNRQVFGSCRQSVIDWALTKCTDCLSLPSG